MCLSLPLLHFVSALLYLVRLLIVLLLRQVRLDLSKIQKLRREFKDERQILFKILSVLLELLRVSHLQLLDFHLVFLLRLGQDAVPVLVKLLILFNVRLLDLLLALLMCEDQLLELHVELLLFQF